MKENYQRSETQFSYKDSAKKSTRSFSSYKVPTILQQFKKKAKQSLIDDIKMRKVYESLRPANQTCKNQLKQFIKQFSNTPKEHFIDLALYFVDKYVDLVNLKIYLWYIKEGKQTNNFEDIWPFCGILDKFSQQYFTDQNQKTLNKTASSQSITNFKKSSSFNYEQIDPLDDFYTIPSKLQRFDSLPDGHQKKNIQTLKGMNKFFQPLQNFFQSLSLGNIEQACKNKFPEFLSNKLKVKIIKFLQHCEVIRNVINYLNNTSSLSSSDKVKPEVNLKSLNTIYERIIKKSDPRQCDKIIKNRDSDNKRQQVDLSQPSIQSLQKSLNQARKLFNDKSMQFALQKRKYLSQMQQKLKILREDNNNLNEQIMDLNQIIQKKNVQNSILRSQKNIQMKRITQQYERENKLLREKMIKIQDELSNYSKKVRQVEQQSRFNLQRSQTQGDKISNELNRMIQSYKRDNIKLRQDELISQNKIKQLQNKIYELSKYIQQIKIQNESQIRSLQLKIKTIQNKYKILQITNNQSINQLNKYKQQLYKIKQQSLQLSNQNQYIIKQSQYYIQLNSLFQSSNILSPISHNIIKKVILNNSQFISNSINVQLQSNILKNNHLYQLIEKQFLINQIQKYTQKVDYKGQHKILAFKLLYRFDNQLKHNFHQFIDHKPNFLLLLKLKSGAVIGAYSHQPLRKGFRTEFGFLFSLTLMESYFLKDKYCLIYDDYYLIFGNSQIRIRVGQNLFYSNFGISKAHFQVHERKFTEFLLTETEREQPIEFFEIYQVVYGDY